MSFDPLTRAVVDKFQALERRISDIERKLAANEKLLDGNEYLSPSQVAKLRDCTPAAIRARIRSGAIPAVQEGKLWWIRRSDVEPPVE